MEDYIGFRLYENVKDFYSRILCIENTRFIKGYMPLDLSVLIKPTGNVKFDNWLAEAVDLRVTRMCNIVFIC